MKLGELASRLGAELRGDAELEVTGVKGIEEAGPSEITFVANPRYATLARTTQAAAVLVEPEFQEISSRDTAHQESLSRLFPCFGHVLSTAGLSHPVIHPTAVIDPSAEIGEGAHIGAYVVIGPQVRFGANATLLPHVVLYPGSADRQPLLCTCSCGGARELHSWRPRDAGEWRRDWRGRFRFRQE